MLQVHVVNRCDQWVWSMDVSIGGGYTGKSHHEVSLFLLPVSFFAASFLRPFFVKKRGLVRNCFFIAMLLHLATGYDINRR